MTLGRYERRSVGREQIPGIRRVQDADVRGKAALVRVDYNVPLRDGEIADDTRIRASIPTIVTLADGGAKVVLVTHLGRPGGHVVPSLRLGPISSRLSERIGRPVVKLDDSIGDDVVTAIREGRGGDIFLLENVRFYPEEESNDAAFAAALARPADLFVNDAFGTVHRSHASTLGVAELLPSYAGLLMQREVDVLSGLLEDPARPYIAIIGGKKAGSKLGALRDLIPRIDGILVGGGVAFSLLYAQGAAIGDSLVEESLLDEIREILEAAAKKGVEIVLPLDVQLAQRLDAKAEVHVGDARSIPTGWAGFDIGPKTVEAFRRWIQKAKTLVWTGPMGAFECEPFAAGTEGVAEAIAASSAFSVIGGGETGEAVARFGYGGGVSYISTGGGACLAMLRGKTLPALEALRSDE